MAVTQQLARLPLDLLARCRSSVDVLQGVCSQKTLSTADHLDLDWSPSMLWRLAIVAYGEGAVHDTLRRALEGGDVVNADYRETWMFSNVQVTSLEPEDVRSTAAELRAIDPAALFGALPADRGPALSLLGISDGGPSQPIRSYVESHFRALRDFYDGAADRALAVLLWWD